MIRAVLPSASARPAESSASSARISACCGAWSSATRMPSSCSSAHPPDASSVSETATSTSMLWVRTTLRSSGRTISAHSSASDGASAAALRAHPADSKKHRISTKRRTLRSDREQGLLRHRAGPLPFSVSEPACIPPCGCAAPPPPKPHGLVKMLVKRHAVFVHTTRRQGGRVGARFRFTCTLIGTPTVPG